MAISFGSNSGTPFKCCGSQGDYKHSTDVVIKIFDDRIIFSNPGTLFGNLTLKDLEKDDYVSSIRNRLLAEAFYLTGDIEKYGTGFIRIRKTLSQFKGATYEISETGDFFIVKLLSSPTNDLENDLEKYSNDLEQDLRNRFDLSKHQILILKSVVENQNVTQKKLSKIVGITEKNVRNNMKKLKEMGILERIGPDKGGYWKIRNK